MSTTGTKKKKVSKRKQDRPGELRREAKRLEDSRDNLKERIRSKSAAIKKLGGALDDTRASREAWREKAERWQREARELDAEIEQHMKNQLKNDKTIAALLEDIKKKG